MSRSGMELAEPLDLLERLYSTYSTVEGLKAKPFSDFLSWGTMLLADFDEIDQHLGNGNSVFNYLDEIKAINHWNTDGSPLTPLEKEYLRFFNSLSFIYSAFRDQLITDKKAYFGLAFNQLLNKLDEDPFVETDRIIFAGFNALTPAEEKLITYLITSGKGETIWDADAYYLDDKQQEAGLFLRKYFSDPGFGTPGWIDQHYKTGQKKIAIFGVPGNVGQCKLAGQLLDELTARENPSDIALVLVNEGLMLPALNSVPAGIRNINITMGFPVKLTPVYSLFETCFTLFINARKYGNRQGLEEGDSNPVLRFHLGDIAKFTGHPYVAPFLVRAAEKEKKRKKVVKTFRNSAEFKNYLTVILPDFEPLFRSILESGQITVADFIHFSISLLEFFRKRFQPSGSGEQSPNTLDLEYLYQFALIFSGIQKVITRSEWIKEIEVLYEVFKAQTASCRIPFYGEPLNGLQMMGMLETRTLDFKTVILLSANEGQLPKSKHHGTFLPDEVRKEFGLHRYRERNAVFAYHFYRLMQRAETVYLLYSTEGNETGEGEKSRFISQVVHELPSYNPGISVKEKILSLPPYPWRETMLSIEKDQLILQRLRSMAEYGFSPTSLSSFLACSLQFCYRYVLGFEEKAQIEESVDASVLGDVVHTVLHEAYRDLGKNRVVPADPEIILPEAVGNVNRVFSREYSGADMESGRNLLILKVAEGMVKRFLAAEKRFLDGLPEGKQYLDILHLEHELKSSLTVTDATTGELIPILLRGRADRIDRVGEQVRIIDYKTGKVEDKDVKLEDVGMLRSHKNPSKLFQLLAYAWLYHKRNPDSRNELASGIISLRLPSRYLIPAVVGNSVSLDDACLQGFEEVLKDILADLFNASLPFIQTNDQEICSFCEFRLLCNRVVH